MSWKETDAKNRISTYFNQVKDPTIKDYKRDMSFERIATNTAYRVDGVHIYIEITNFLEILKSTSKEGTDCHKRALRFLDLHQRAVHRILKEDGVTKIDFNGARLHAVVTKPYNTEPHAEKRRVQKAVAISNLIVQVLKQTGDIDEKIENAVLRVGIDTGLALAVNNGRAGNREPLFLGEPANWAAKLAAEKKSPGIYLTEAALAASNIVSASGKLTADDISTCVNNTSLASNVAGIVNEWRKDANTHRMKDYSFSGHTPPMNSLRIDTLTPAQSRHQEMVSIYADIDNFTKYVRNNIKSNEGAKNVIRTLHVIRSELDAVLSTDFQGRKIRFIGDCIHGVLLDGTAYSSDGQKTVSTATLTAAAMRSSFNLCLGHLTANDVDVADIGLAIGFEYGPVSITRLGVQRSLTRCCLGRTVIASEEQQKRCNGSETAMGPNAYSVASDGVKGIFGFARYVKDLEFELTLEKLEESEDQVAKVVVERLYEPANPAIVAAVATEVSPYAT